MTGQATTFVSEAEFIFLMNEMKWKAIRSLGQPHYRNFSLSKKSADISSRLDSLAITRDAAADAVVDELKNTITNKGQNTSDTIQNSVTDSTTAYQNKLASSSDTSTADADWLKDMDAEEEKAQTTAHQNIHESFTKARELGLKHPAARSGIKVVMSTITSFFNSIFDKISEFLLNIAKTVIGAIEKAWAAIKKTFNEVKNFITSFF